MATALFGAFHSVSPAIALFLTGPCILDLEIWLIMQAFRAARKYLFRVSCEKMDAFLRIASFFQGGISKACEPPETLSFYLKQLGWSIDMTGQIHFHAFLSFHFLRISYKRLLRFAVQAWQDKLMILHTQRFRLFSFPSIDRVSTVEILKRFSSGQRWHLIRDIAGGYQTQQQKHEWALDADPNCNFCGQPDTKPHRLLHCPMFASTRECHQDIVQCLNDPDCLLTDFPVCFVDPHTHIRCSSYNFVTPSRFLLQRHFNLRSQRNWSKIQSIGVQMAHVFIRKALVHVTCFCNHFGFSFR